MPAIAKKEHGSHCGVVEAYHRLHELGHAHPLKSGVKMSLSAVCTAWPSGTLFCGESMFSRMENASKTALLVFCDEFIRHGGKLIDCRSLTITQHRLVPAKFAGITLIISIKCASDDCRIISGYLDACFHHKNECFRHISPQSVIIAVAELVTLIVPAADKEFFASGNAHRLSHRPYTLRFWCGLAVCFRSNVPNLFVAI
ncbi:hypothetical protein DMI65_20005 [Escherichia coli]|nr:hypothetical protein [Escherichia coli]